MFIKEFSIRRYGPLPDSGRVKPGFFNLLFGPNEDGKTLTIDALLRLLFAKEILSYFKEAQRVTENPEGYVVLENGQERKLPAGGLLSDFYPLSPREFSRVFVIRDSDLAISGEGDFYRQMTARLTGMRTFEIRKIMEQIQAMGYLTPKKSLQNTEPFKFKERLKAAENLLEQAQLLKTRLVSAGFGRLEENLARLTQKQAALKEELEGYRAALRRDKYLKGRAALDRLSEVQEKLANLENCQKDDYLRWQKAAAKMSHFAEMAGAQKARLLKTRQEHAETEARVKDYLLLTGKLKEDSDEAAKVLSPLLEEHGTQQVKLKQREAFFKSALVSPFLLVVTVLFLLTLAGIIFKPAGWLFYVFTISALLFAASWLSVFSLQHKYSRQKARAEKIKLQAATLSLRARSVEEAQLALANLNQDYTCAAEELAEYEKEKALLEREITRLAAELEENICRTAAEEERTEIVKDKSGLGSLGELAACLEQKESLAAEQKTLLGLLSSHFAPEEGGEAKPDGPSLLFWEERVEKEAPYKEAAPGITYSQVRADEARKNLKMAEEEQVLLREDKQAYLKELQATENSYNEIMQFAGEERLLCQTVVDLEKIIEKLEAWINEYLLKVAAARHVLWALEKLEAEEEEKVSSLFGTPSPVSSYFNQATLGQYVSVHFQSADEPLQVVSREGTFSSAASLSGGTYDQLYFSVRLALAKKLLAGETGFFILDDPFIKADAARLKMMLKMLLEVASAGWQIFYFSAKEEVKEALKNEIASGQVKVFKIGLGRAEI